MLNFFLLIKENMKHCLLFYVIWNSYSSNYKKWATKCGFLKDNQDTLYKFHENSPFYSIFNCALLSFILYETSHIWKLIHLTLHHVNILFRTQVMDGTLTFDVDAMVFVAPNPQQADKFFALIYPLDMTVWLFILISFFIVTFAFLLLSNTEEKVKNLYHL